MALPVLIEFIDIISAAIEIKNPIIEITPGTTLGARASTLMSIEIHPNIL